MALAAARISYELREISLKSKPAAMLALSPKGTVPVLHRVQAGLVLDESLEIMRWALTSPSYAGVERVAQDATLVEYNDRVFKKALDAYKYPQRSGMSDALRACLVFVQNLETLLAQSLWLGGAEWDHRDLAIFPFIRQFHGVDKHVITSSTFPHVFRWLETWLESELFSAIMTKHATWTPGDPPLVYQDGVYRTTRAAQAVSGASISVASFYRFVRIEDCHALREHLQNELEKAALLGTILLAHEGINGTIAGTAQQVHDFMSSLKTDARFAQMDVKYQLCEQVPFSHIKVRVKKEIVAGKDLSVDVLAQPLPHVSPEDWDRLIQDPDVVLIDVRNDYEYALGHFPNAINPNTRSFGEFKPFVAQSLDPSVNRKVAMYCTGGIRCEKAAVMMQKLGFAEVYQLDGGILNYLEHHKQRSTAHQWQGECFVFDERVTLNPQLEPTTPPHCANCRRPYNPVDGCITCSVGR